MIQKTMKVFAVILFFATPLFAQCTGADGIFAPVRFTYPAKITDYSGQKLFFSVETSDTVHITEKEVDENTQFPIGFEKDYKNGRYFIFICDNQPEKVAWVQKIRPSSVKIETKKEQDKRLKKGN